MDASYKIQRGIHVHLIQFFMCPEFWVHIRTRGRALRPFAFYLNRTWKGVCTVKKLQTTLDKITTLISAILCAAMMVILFANVVLRLIPGIGGFKWYMESSQYLNVWSMLITCIGINAMGTNLRVEVVDSILGKTPLGKKIVVIIRDVFIILFYVMVTYGGYQLCTRAKQAVSTMPQFTMGQVYTIFPIAGVLCILSAVLNLIVELTAKPEGGKSK